MKLTRTQKRYPRHVIRRIVEEQMRFVIDDGALYANAIRNVYAAFDMAERYTNRLIVRSLATFGLDAMTSLVDIPTAPVLSIREVAYYDSNDELQILPSSEYQLLTTEDSTAVEFFSIPKLSDRRRRGLVSIVAECGYSDYRDTLSREPEDAGGIILPGNIEAAVALRAGTLCEADGDAIIGRSVSALPVTVERLLDPFRMAPYGWES